jgi:hypothetical protein
MLDKLKTELILDWRQWVDHFDKFVGNNPRDPEEKLWQYRHHQDYCTWMINDENIWTISYQYVHCLDESGKMFCLQSDVASKRTSLENYQTIYQAADKNHLPILNHKKIIDGDLLYTEFSSPQNCLGYPPAYNLIEIMTKSQNVSEDFTAYLVKIIDAHYWLVELCLKLDLPFYENHHVLVNHFLYQDEIYFKDTLFYFTSENRQEIEMIAHSWMTTLDGFRRAQGIISAYRSRNDASEETVKEIYQAIDTLIDYSYTKCQKLKN